MSYEAIAVLMFSTFMLLLLTGQRVFGAIGFVATAFALALWGEGAVEMPFASTITLINWYPMLTLPMFVYMGYMLSESGIANDLYRMFHVWTGPMRGGLAVGTILLMVAISAMNGLSVAGMAIGATIALPELLKRGYDKIMVTGVIQAGSSLGIMIPPSVVLVLYGMIARQPVGQLWLAGIGPGLLLAVLFILYIVIRCHLQPHLGPPLPLEERQQITWGEKIRLLKAGVLPLLIIFSMTGLFVLGVTSMVESSAMGAFTATLVAWYKGRITRKVMEDTLRKSLAVSAMFMWIILAALAFGAVFDGLGAVKAIEVLFLEKWGLEPWQVLVLMQLSYIVMGTFLDDTAMLIIVAPLYVPLVIALGFNPIWYGILYTITCQIAYITPPFGYNLFLMRAMAPKEVTLIDIYKSIIPFVLIMLRRAGARDHLPRDRALAAEPRLPEVAGELLHQRHRHGRVVHDLLRDGSQEEDAERTEAVRAHGDRLAAEFGGAVGNRLGRVAFQLLELESAAGALQSLGRCLQDGTSPLGRNLRGSAPGSRRFPPQCSCSASAGRSAREVPPPACHAPAALRSRAPAVRCRNRRWPPGFCASGSPHRSWRQPAASSAGSVVLAGQCTSFKPVADSSAGRAATP